MADDEVARNLQSMDELDFTAWNQADWQGVFARYHTDDVLVDVHALASERSASRPGSVTAWLERGEQHLHQECPS